MHHSLHALWRALSGDKQCPDLPESSFAAFMAILDASRDLEDARGFARWPIDDEPDPYPAIARGSGASLAMLVAAIRVAELVPISSPGLQDATLYVDTICDATSQHRVYLRDEESLPGTPWAVFPSIDAAACWMLKWVQGERDASLPVLDDEWEQSPRSGGFVLEAILEEELPALWETRSARVRDGAPRVRPFPQEDRALGWGRRACLWYLRNLVEGGKLGLGSTDALEVTAHQRGFLMHLLELESWIHNAGPGDP